ncbi:site-specific DNA-methyltransferase [Arthrobacter sp. zg-Y826]|uniref:DNA-methyltransferase n=1 Tax=Arthrobacter jinronghuae TaxID=2964609 RepID=UPI002106DB44|nr:site-specific DNA-methyltransferase [Arthrobacter jinronghuae]MCQ1957004.1 site-specific DNA-methyltransferase [Arthrobacter jinronghuae]
METATRTPLYLLHGDATELFSDVRTESVDLVLTDPPYNLGTFMADRQTNLAAMRANNFVKAGWDNQNYDQWTLLMDCFLAESARCLRLGGALVTFMSIIKVESIVRLAEKHGLYYKTTGIWHKTNPMPRNMNLHFVNSTESWVYFTKKKKTGTFNNGGKVVHDFISMAATPASEKRLGAHPTQKPVQLMEHFIRLLTNPGEEILDPFMGSGSSGVAARNLERRFTGFEKDETYYKLARARVQIDE